MPRQLWMADVLRSAGLTVHEVSGWKTRGVTDFQPQGLIVHETMGSLTSSDAGEINVMINGREGLSGPIAHLYLSRTGHWHVVTSGFSHHVRTGWAGPFNGWGNYRLLGIEAQHAKGEPWTAVQYGSYARGVAAILRHTGWKVAGHKEHQPGDKIDPQFDMGTFRADVTAVMNGDDDMFEQRDRNVLTADTWRTIAVLENRDAAVYQLEGEPAPRREVNGLKVQLDRLEAKVAALSAPVFTDEQLAKLADLLAARIPRPPTPLEVAKAVLDEDHKRSEA